MPPKSKTTGKGGKSHKRAKNGASAEAQVKELVLRIDGQYYGKVCKMLGNGRVSCKVFMDSGEKMLMCIIPGKFRKRIWINMEDLVLVGVRSYQDDKADILYKYSALEAKRLIRMGEVPINESDVNDDTEDQINDNIQWITDQKEPEKNEVRPKKTVTIIGNGSYINEDFLPPNSDDDDESPKKDFNKGRINKKAEPEPTEAGDVSKETEGDSDEEGSESEEDGSKGSEDSNKASKETPNASDKSGDNLKYKIKSVSKKIEEIDLDDL